MLKFFRKAPLDSLKNHEIMQKDLPEQKHDFGTGEPWETIYKRNVLCVVLDRELCGAASDTKAKKQT